jgi:hypothetical protein
MSPKSNFLFFLNSYNDLCQTSTPALNQFKWSREINGVPYTLSNSQEIQVLPSTTTSEILPYSFSNVAASTAGTTNGTTTLTIIGSTTGIAVGQLIVGTGIPVGTFVDSITGSAVTMSQAATATGSPSVTFYTPASFIYLESDKAVSVIYNNGSPMALNPFEINGLTVSGVFFMNGPVYSITITNSGTATANVFFASMG